MMKRVWLIALLLSLVIALPIVSACAKTPTAPPTSTPAPAPAPAPAPVAVTKWKVMSGLPGVDTPVNVWTKQMFDEIKKETGGRLDITFYLPGELPYKSADLLRVIRDGSIHVAVVPGGPITGDIPIFALDSLPYLAGTADEYYKLRAVAKPYWDRELAKLNQTGLLYFTYPPQQFFTVKEARTLEDLKGMKIRTWSQPLSEMATLLGINPMQIAVEEVATALQYGTVEGAITAWTNLVATKLDQIVKYALEADISVSTTFFTVNNDALKALPKDVQDKVVQIALKYQDDVFSKGLMADDSTKKAQAVSKYGIVVSKVPNDKRAAIAKLERPKWDSWAAKAGGDAPEILNAVIKALGK